LLELLAKLREKKMLPVTGNGEVLGKKYSMFNNQYSIFKDISISHLNVEH